MCFIWLSSISISKLFTRRCKGVPVGKSLNPRPTIPYPGAAPGGRRYAGHRRRAGFRRTRLTPGGHSGYTPAMQKMDGVLSPGWLRRAGTKIQNVLGYVQFQQDYRGRGTPASAAAAVAQTEAELNRRMRTYPSNHYYRVVQRRLVPGFQLYERLRLITPAYPQPLQSFLDIGCCRGFFVLDAATWRGCPRAVGIDVHEPFVAVGRDVARYLSLEGAAFQYASLAQVSDDPQQFGGPFQVVLLIGTYHYLFWGSRLCPTAYYSHEEIFRRLASICTDRLIISARITTDRLPGIIKDRLTERPSAVPYTAQAFLENAAKFFRVSHLGHLGADPLFVMSKS